MDGIETGRPAAPAPKTRVRRAPATKRRPRRRKPALRWSEKRAALFLAELAETANIAQSARASGLSESTIRRHKQTDDEFAARWAAALREGFEKLETMLLHRALHGVEKAVWHGGRQVGTILEYSDRLALALLAAHRAEVTGIAPAVAGSPPMSDEEVRVELARRLSDMNLRMGGGG